MNHYLKNKEELETNGFSITNVVFTKCEVDLLIHLIENYSSDFSIRQLVNQVPEVQKIIFKNKSFKALFQSVCSEDYFLSKAIYFNKSSNSNWFVGYHQDMSISVQERIEEKNYTNWTFKKEQLGVIPPIDILKSIVTFRIHLDDTNDTNGALRVIQESHHQGIIRIDQDFDISNYGSEIVCEVSEGAVMLMKPLLLHASNKSSYENDRRVIHLEFSNQEIPMGWLEKRKIS